MVNSANLFLSHSKANWLGWDWDSHVTIHSSVHGIVDLTIVLSHFSVDSSAELDINDFVAATDVLNPVHVCRQKHLWAIHVTLDVISAFSGTFATAATGEHVLLLHVEPLFSDFLSWLWSTSSEHLSDLLFFLLLFISSLHEHLRCLLPFLIESLSLNWSHCLKVWSTFVWHDASFPSGTLLSSKVVNIINWTISVPFGGIKAVL